MFFFFDSEIAHRMISRLSSITSLFFLISIGKTTSATIYDKGYKPELTSKMQSYEGISKSFLKFLKSYNYEIS